MAVYVRQVPQWEVERTDDPEVVPVTVKHVNTAGADGSLRKLIELGQGEHRVWIDLSLAEAVISAIGAAAEAWRSK